MPESAAHDHALRAADLAALGRWDAAQSLALTAIALHLTEPEFDDHQRLSPVSTGDDSESRQPTGLTRLLAEPAPAHLPGNIIVTPTEWSLWNDDRSVFYGLVSTSDGGVPAEYTTYRGDGVNVGDHQSLAAAVAYLIQRRTEETGDES